MDATETNDSRDEKPGDNTIETNGEYEKYQCRKCTANHIARPQSLCAEYKICRDCAGRIIRRFLDNGKIYQIKSSGHRQILFDIVLRRGPIKMGELYQLYTEEVENPRSRRQVRTYLSEMASAGTIRVKGRTNGRYYRSPL